MSYKCCAVPLCTNTTIKTPQKLFVTVSKNVKVRRKWLKLANRDPNEIKDTSVIYFCEDHFDMEKDMANYIQHKMGFTRIIRMKETAVPTKFDCQNYKLEDRKKSKKKKQLEIKPSSNLPEYVPAEMESKMEDNKSKLTDEVDEKKELVEEVNIKMEPTEEIDAKTEMSGKIEIKIEVEDLNEDTDYIPMYMPQVRQQADEKVLVAGVKVQCPWQIQNKETSTDSIETHDKCIQVSHLEHIENPVQQREREDSALSSINIKVENNCTQDQTKSLIVKMYNYLQNEYIQMKDMYGNKFALTPLSKVKKRVAEATGIDEETLTKLLEEGKEGDTISTSPRRKSNRIIKKRNIRNYESDDGAVDIKKIRIKEECTDYEVS